LAELDQLIPLLQQLEPLELQKAQLLNQLKLLNDQKEQLSSLQLASNTLKNKLEPLILSRDQLCKQMPIVEQERNEANNILDSTVREAEQLQQAIRKATIAEKLLSLEANIKRDKELRQLLLDLPDINLGIVEQLRDKQQQLKLAEITMQSLATKIELLMAESAVYINGEPLTIGSSTCLNSTSILQMSGLELRIIPGDGGKVAQAMAKHEFLETSLKADLQRLRVETIEQAVHLERHRSELLTEQKRLQAEKASESVEDLRGALDRYANDQLPIASIDDLRKQLDDLVPIGKERRQAFNQLDNKLTNQRQQLANCNQIINTQQAELVKTDTLLEELLKRFSSVDEVDGQLSKLNLNISELEMRQEILKKQLISDFPGYKGFNSSHAHQQREEALQKSAAAGALLGADGINDRYAQREQLEAALEARTSERERLEQDALMLDLLRQLLQEEQTSMALQYTEPVTKKLDSYLSCCFPGPMQSSLEYQSTKGFQNLQWQRGDSAVAWEFSALSGGTKEILAASLRLAMAEVLANAYSGCLPIVFDDAFSNVDPGRWPWVSALLQKGVNQGLQLILFSCDPNFCEALPANQRLQLS
jgi:DNA repair exonuclease SbcCD ATPase subunit